MWLLSLTLLRARELVEWGRMCQQRWVRWREQCWNGEREPRWKSDTTEDNSRTLLYFSALSLCFFFASLHQLLNHRRRWNNKRIFSARCKFLIFSNVSDVGDLLWSFNTQLSLISFARPCGSSSTARERYKTQEMSETKTQREIVVWPETTTWCLGIVVGCFIHSRCRRRRVLFL